MRNPAALESTLLLVLDVVADAELLAEVAGVFGVEEWPRTTESMCLQGLRRGGGKEPRI